ncbi:MAG: hypothetical protein IJV22_07650 [Bacteroidales bacterium]|nr:hypothetical protein [Bacteroidales bacterium]
MNLHTVRHQILFRTASTPIPQDIPHPSTSPHEAPLNHRTTEWRGIALTISNNFYG